MAGSEPQVMVKLPRDLIARMDEVSSRISRNRGWIVRRALRQWLAAEERRHQRTLEALKDVDGGKATGLDKIRQWLERRRDERRRKSAARG